MSPHNREHQRPLKPPVAPKIPTTIRFSFEEDENSNSSCTIRQQQHRNHNNGAAKTKKPFTVSSVSCSDDDQGDVKFDVEFTDDYYWLRDNSNPNVLKYLQEENEYAYDYMNRCTASLQKELYDEFKSRIREDDSSIPYKLGDYYYYTKYDAGKDLAKYCRKRILHEDDDHEEEVLLDLNVVAEEGSFEYVDVGVFEISPDQSKLCYSLDTTGNEYFTIHFKDLTTATTTSSPPRQFSAGINANNNNERRRRGIENTYYYVVWANDNRTIFYTTLNDAGRSYRLYRHEIGNGNEDDELIYEEEDEEFIVQVSKTNSGRYIVMQVTSLVGSEVRILDADKPRSEFRMLYSGRRLGLDYHHIQHHRDSDYLFVLTNDPYPCSHPYGDRMQIVKVRASSDDPSNKENWEPVLSFYNHDNDEDIPLIESMDVFSDYMVVFEIKRGLRAIRIIDLKKQHHNKEQEQQEHEEEEEGRWCSQSAAGGTRYEYHYVPLPEKDVKAQVYTLWQGGPENYTYMHPPHRDYNSNVLRFTFSSFSHPDRIFDYDMSTRTLIELNTKQQQAVVSSGGNGRQVDLSKYKTERIYATARSSTDGGGVVKIPISLVYRADMLKRDGSNPMLMQGYGAYGDGPLPRFDMKRLSLLDRGFVFGMAHVRGGTAMVGSLRWYHEGKLLHKKNSFLDFIACAERVIEAGFTSSDRLAIYGRSAGGLLVCASTMMRPQGLFKAVFAEVPFVEAINSMLDPSIPWTVYEYNEWGNPRRNREMYEYMRSYCPYSNIKPGAEYPHMLLTGGLNDNRVAYWEPAKFVAKMRASKIANNDDDTNNNDNTTGGDSSSNILLLLTKIAAGHFGSIKRYDALQEAALEYAFIIYATTLGNDKYNSSSSSNGNS